MNCELSIHYHSYVINVANQGYWACCRKLIILQTVFIDLATFMNNTSNIIEEDRRRGSGKVTLVGFGPGDPDLITVKGLKALENADAIFYDDLTNEEFLRRFEAEKVYVGKRSGKHSAEQDELNQRLYERAAKGDNVVRLKGGDPMLFAHGREEIDFLKSRSVEVEVVPGVSSGFALASLLQIPLTHRGLARSVAFVLGHGQNIQTPNADTLLYYMGGAYVSSIAKALLESGRSADTPAALVTNISLPSQNAVYTTVGDLRYAVFRDTPVLIIVGEVVGFEAESHAGKTLLFVDEKVDLNEVDKIRFSSPSSVETFRHIYSDDVPKRLLLLASDQETFYAISKI